MFNSGERRTGNTVAPDPNHHYQEFSMNKNQVKGSMEEAKGKIKEVAGKVVGNKELEQKGQIQNAAGKVQAAVGDVQDDVKKASRKH
jgi:uncharacterized protein YjbJ (UPF0337 family)